jgi:hypothetical protein
VIGERRGGPLAEGRLLRRSRGRYAAVWIYESREAWQRLWGTPAEPRRFPDYPENWRIWEEEVLAPLLSEIPDAIAFTAYDEL